MEKLLEFCNIADTSVKEFEGKKNYIATGDVIENRIIKFEEITFNNRPSRANQMVKIGDVLFAKMKDTIKVLMIDENNVDNIYSTGFFVIEPKNNIESKFIYWLFNSNSFNEQKNKNCKGATQKALNNEGLSKITIMELPTLSEQRKIINKLDKIQEIINIRKKQKEDLDRLIKSKFVELFGNVEYNEKNFKEVEMQNIAKISSSKRIYAREYQENGVPFYRSKEIIELAQNKKPTIELFISKERYEEIREKYGVPKKGDVLITAVGTIGVIWVVDTSEPFYYKDGNLLQVRLNENISHIYFKYVLNKLINIFKNKNVSGSAYLALTIEKFKHMKIILPPIELQNEFENIVKKIEKQNSIIKKSLEEMENLKKSLMNKYFR